LEQQLVEMRELVELVQAAESVVSVVLVVLVVLVEQHTVAVVDFVVDTLVEDLCIVAVVVDFDFEKNLVVEHIIVVD